MIVIGASAGGHMALWEVVREISQDIPAAMIVMQAYGSQRCWWIGGPTLDLLARRKTELESGLAVSVRTIKDRVALLVRLIAQSKRNPKTHQFLATEMIALELDLRSIQALLDQALVGDRGGTGRPSSRS